MAVPRKVHTPEALGILNDESLAGAGAATIMRSLAPVLDTRLAYFLKCLEDAHRTLTCCWTCGPRLLRFAIYSANSKPPCSVGMRRPVNSNRNIVSKP